MKMNKKERFSKQITMSLAMMTATPSLTDPSHVEPSPGLPAPHQCLDGFLPYWYGCYQLQAAPRTWSTAEKDCQLLGGHLASVHDEAENGYLLASAAGGPTWIGLEKVSTRVT